MSVIKTKIRHLGVLLIERAHKISHDRTTPTYVKSGTYTLYSREDHPAPYFFRVSWDLKNDQIKVVEDTSGLEPPFDLVQSSISFLLQQEKMIDHREFGYIPWHELPWYKKLLKYLKEA